ncbi:MAG: LysR family transcriptional regulator [Hyphomicrobiales bacterium]|nr:LysR family transcriptional regulator [Hyphomicrobiales bacterium]
MAFDTRVLNKIDLNLLKVFKAVYELGQTTAAAEYLGLTQPAVSQALRRLRELTGDPLFVPSRSGMLPTPRASELSVPVNSALAAIQRALERNPDFQPATARRRFRLGMLDYGIMVLAPSVAGVISQHAPGIVVDIMHVPSANAHQMLLDDQIDLVTGPFNRCPAALERTHLFSDAYVVIVRKGHPAAQSGMNLSLLSEIAHVEVTHEKGEGGGIDAALHGLGVRRKKAMRVPVFAGACFIAGKSDMAAIVPRRVALAYAHLCNIELHDLPEDFPRLEISALVDRRNSGDNGLGWLRNILIETASQQEPRLDGRGSV